MRGSKQGTTAEAASASPIAEALDKNKKATEDVKKAADELAVLHAVLDTKLGKGASDEEVARAVAETNDVEKRLTKSAEKLDEVNDVLEGEVKRPTLKSLPR